MWHTQDDPGNFVHKQGFLTKQGARVKTWKRRLFVLDSQGLSYFKTEQVYRGRGEGCASVV